MEIYFLFFKIASENGGLQGRDQADSRVPVGARRPRAHMQDLQEGL